MQKLNNCIVCSNTKCRHNSGLSCIAAVVELSYDGTCLTSEEIDIYKEVEGFSRDENACT